MAKAYRSAKTGRYVTKATATKNPRTTVSQSSKSSKASGSRSAITGRSVKDATAKRHPDTTIGPN